MYPHYYPSLFLVDTKTRVKSTDSVINKVIRLTIQTGTINAVTAVADLVLAFILPHTTANFILGFPLSKLSSVSLVSTLNARAWKETDVTAQPNVLFEPTPVMSSSSFLLTSPHNRSTSLMASVLLFCYRLSAKSRHNRRAEQDRTPS